MTVSPSALAFIMRGSHDGVRVVNWVVQSPQSDLAVPQVLPRVMDLGSLPSSWKATSFPQGPSPIWPWSMEAADLFFLLHTWGLGLLFVQRSCTAGCLSPRTCSPGLASLLREGSCRNCPEQSLEAGKHVGCSLHTSLIEQAQ